ncbi:MAG: sigma-54 dependent transcriptional regulator [Rikenellaceae bacterium]
MAEILVIESSRGVRNILKEKLEYEGFSVEVVDRADEQLLANYLCKQCVVLCSQEIIEDSLEGKLFNMDGEQTPFSVVVISAEKDVNKAVDYIKMGALDFLPKPMDTNRLIAVIKKGLDANKDVVKTVKTPPISRNNIVVNNNQADQIIGSSVKITHIKNLIDKVAPSPARVLITGANGTGKELVARWLHLKSERASSPFVEVNCAAIPSELIESELFGHEKGAFTSAIKQRKGKFEQSDGGTLFLDEIGDMSLSAQAKVLRVLQEHKVSRVGSDKDIDVNVRVLAATNKNLKEEIAQKNFREDLYHRLSVILINVPSLNERVEDIPELVEFFISKVCKEYGLPDKKIDSEAIKTLQTLDWTGNIRQLRNVIERLIILSSNKITAEDVRKYALSTV